MTAMLSTPVCGVERRNAVVAPLLAPWRRSDAATGITPHEQWHPEETCFDNLAEAVAAEVALDPFRGDHHRQQSCNSEAKQQIRRHRTEDRPRGGNKG